MTSPGSRIGPYEIVGLLGRGGMGEVYRARDTRLQRDVALKLLPASVSTDSDTLARFTREAQLLATLNHPHVAAIYGVEDSGSGAALVLELVEGDTLADHIARGPVPVDEAIAIGRQVAEALEAAHEHGIIHRDLKPANIKLRADGTVKVLDFGLAKSMVSPSSSAAHAPDVTGSPTLTAHATAAGLVLGTAAYMAPEQARGRPVDRRADIWAFGVVLFEMITAARPFGGETISETLAAIIKDAPSWTALPPGLPPALRSLIRRTLEKDPRRRLRDIGDARVVLEDLQSGAEVASSAPIVAPVPRWRSALPWALAAVASAAAIGFAARPRGQPGVQPTVKYTLPISSESLERHGLPSLSPDGRHVVFVRGGSLWVRALDQFEPRQLGGTSGAQFPFWSPDSRQVAYLTDDALWRVGIDGSPPIRITTHRFNKGARTPGGAWLADDTLVFAPAAAGTGLYAAPAQGGDVTEFYERDPKTENDLHRPGLLPDGRSLVFVVDHPESGADTIGLLTDGKRKNIFTLKGETLDSPVYSPTGHILYNRDTTSPGVWAMPFDLSRLEVTGPPFLVAPQGSYPSIANSATLLYAEGSVTGQSTLAWLDVGTGQVTPALREQFAAIHDPRLSPDGRRVAAVVQLAGQGQILIVADLQRHTYVRLADAVGVGTRPGWRDDRTVVYSRNDGRGQAIVMRAADGSGDETVLSPGLQPSLAAGRLVFSRISEGASVDLFHLLLPPGNGQPGAPEMLQQLPVHEWEPALSPDGTLLAYTRGDPGQSELILRTYPTQTEQWQVSSGGGGTAVWSPRGDALYYRTMGGPIMRVEVQSKPSVTLGTPQAVPRPSSLIARSGFVVSPDGMRLLMVQEVRTGEQRMATVAVVQNWFSEFRK